MPPSLHNDELIHSVDDKTVPNTRSEEVGQENSDGSRFEALRAMIHEHHEDFVESYERELDRLDVERAHDVDRVGIDPAQSDEQEIVQNLAPSQSSNKHRSIPSAEPSVSDDVESTNEGSADPQYVGAWVQNQVELVSAGNSYPPTGDIESEVANSELNAFTSLLSFRLQLFQHYRTQNIQRGTGISQWIQEQREFFGDRQDPDSENRVLQWVQEQQQFIADGRSYDRM